MTTPKSISLIDPPAAEVPFALLGKGFRPFFLGAALFAVLYMPLWAWVYLKGGATGPFGPIVWHAHEMLHGFTVAVIAGFLLTAVSNWTRESTAEGWLLLGVFSVWLAGRIGILLCGFLPEAFYPIVSAIDLAFLPIFAGTIARPIFKTKNKRNYGFPIILMVMWVSNLLMHLDVYGITIGMGMKSLYLALHMILVIVILITGRIVPLFTRNALDDMSIQSNPKVDKLCVGLAVLFAAISISGIQVLVPWVALALALALVVRSWKWGSLKTLKVPLLWILHFGNLWLILGFTLLAMSSWGVLAPSVAIHGLTTGVLGILCLGMMARVTRGHTGRDLTTDKLTTLAFVLMVGAVLTRVGGPIVGGSAVMTSIVVSAGLWSAAFLLYLTQHAHMLLTPRPDGRPG